MFDYIDGEKFEGLADISFGDMFTNSNDVDIKKISDCKKDCPVVFCGNDRIADLFSKLSNTDKTIDLISHNGDRNFNSQDVASRPKNIRFWFSQNMSYSDGYNCPLPIGLERQFWSERLYGKVGHKLTCLLEIMNSQINKTKILYINFTLRTNRERQKSVNLFTNKPYAVVEIGDNKRNYHRYLKNMKESKFILSPEGHGLDCHRTWEALYVGSIPIIERNFYYENMYNDLPVLLVDDYSMISERFLKNKYEEIVNMTFNMEKLKFSYWEEKIRRYCGRDKT